VFQLLSAVNTRAAALRAGRLREALCTHILLHVLYFFKALLEAAAGMKAPSRLA
jgi:hypothetical protein